MSPDAKHPVGAKRPLWLELLVVLVAFVAVTALAYVLGAPNLGTAATFGQIVFIFGVVGLMLRR